MRLSSKFAESWSLITRHRSMVVLTMLVVLLGGFAFAQEATIVGTVTDPTGAAIPNVKITITNAETGQATQIPTNADGQYVIPGLRVGTYTVRAEGTGFKTAERKDLKLQVADRVRADFQMQLGTAQETVSVEAETIAVQSESGEVSSVITSQQITQLATNGRSMYSLASLTPGASANTPDFQIPTPVAGNGTISFNGLRNGHNLYLLDGAESADRGGAGNSDVMPSLDALGEFRILTSNYSAQYGLSSAGTMTALIKSGTNSLHASAWYFGRNDALDARNYFNPAPNKVAKLRFHTYGFNVGGPIDAWRKEHKSFFFYNMEWRTLIQGGLTNVKVPDQAWYQGSIPKSAVPGGNALIVPNLADSVLFANCEGNPGVTKGSPFPNDPANANNFLIPSCMLDQNMQLALGAGVFPAPTSGSNFIGGADSPTHVREEVVRIDHTFNSKFSVFGHFLAEQISQNFGTTLWNCCNLVPTVGTSFGNPSYSGVVHVLHTISPTLLNEIAFNYNGNRINIVPVSQLGTTHIGQPTGFDVPRLFTGPNSMTRIPAIQLNGATTSFYTTGSWPWHNKADDYQVRDDFSWTRGAHQFKLGGSWAIYKKVQDLFGTTQGNYRFDNNYTNFDFGDALLGLASNYNELAVQDKGLWNNQSWALYFEDNWRATRRLTLNLGIRWDGVPHTYEANNRMGNFYPGLYDINNAALMNSDGTVNVDSPGLGTSPNPILAGFPLYLNGIGIPGKNGVPKGLVDNHWAAFGPRFGFAYDLTGSGNTVLRGGLGFMYERIQGNDMYNGGPNIPFSAQVTFQGVSFSNPSTDVGTGNTKVAPITAADITGIDRKLYKLPTVAMYSIGVQRQMGHKSVLELSYVGNQTRHQNNYININLPDVGLLPELVCGSKCANVPNFNTVVPFLGFHSLNMAQDTQNGHYNSFQAEFHSQARKDLFIQAAYTLSKSIDATSGGSGGDLANVSNPYIGWKSDAGRPSYLDRTHIAFVNFVYDLPFFRNSSNKGLKVMLGGWQLSGIISFQTGLPLNVTEGGIGFTCSVPDQNPCLDPASATGNYSNVVPNSANRPNINGSVSYPKKVGAWFDTSNFSPTLAGEFGNAPFNAVRGPGRQNWNTSLFKSFNFTERARLEFRAEFFNTWNHTQFQNPNTTFSSGDFGQIKSANDPREIQLGAKFYF